MEWKLATERGVLCNPGYKNRLIDTNGGTMRYQAWVEREVRRVNQTNPERCAKVRHRDNKIYATAYNYLPLVKD